MKKLPRTPIIAGAIFGLTIGVVLGLLMASILAGALITIGMTILWVLVFMQAARYVTRKSRTGESEY